MGRTSPAKASIAELKKRIEQAKKDKEKVKQYLNSLEEKYHSKHVTYDQYHEGLRKHIHGKTPASLLHYYDSYIKLCEFHIKHSEKKVLKNEVKVILASLFFVLIIIVGFFLTPNFVGYITQEPVSNFYDEINLVFDFSQEYEWEIQNLGALSYVNIDGILKEQGEVKIYLDNFLIYDSTSSLSSTFSFPITGNSIEEGNLTNNETIILNNSNSEELNSTEEVSENNGTSPSQSEPLPSSEQENIQETQEINTSVLEIFQACEETCDLKNYGLNKSSYTLRIEINKGSFELNKINYGLISEKSVEESISEKSIEGEVLILNEETIQGQAILGQSVVWKKTVSLEKFGKVRITVPNEAENIVVKKTKEQEKTSKFSITGNVVFDRNFFSSLTGRAVDSRNQEKTKEIIIEDNALEYEIEYTTPAPYSEEENLPNGKKVKIIGSENIHYENVLVFTNLSEELKIKNPSKIRIYWYENKTYLPVEKIEDKDGDGIFDYVEWIAPHLSNQTFEIIVITKAEHLDNNKNFISDIYEEVKELDNVWSEEIFDNEYVRVTFEKRLTSENDITLYPRIVSGNPAVEVYEVNSEIVIAEFTSLNSNEYNKIYLNNLIGEQDTFDLRVVGGSLEFDHIIDPSYESKWADSHITGTVSTPANALGPADGSWTTNTGAWASRFSMDNPSGSLTGIQTINVLTRTSGTGTGIPAVTVTLYENGASVSQLVSTTVAYVEGNKIISGTFDASSITNADNVEIYVDSTLQGGGKNANTAQIDSIEWNVSYDVIDNTYPQFTSLTNDPSNASNYSSGQIYQFNSTVSNTNGTVYLSFLGTNYSATVDGNVYYVDFGSLPAGTYYYSWWGYGNGANENFNSTDSFEYTVNKTAGTASLTTNLDWTRTYNTSDSSTLYSESNNGDGDVDYEIWRDDVLVSDTDLVGAAGTYIYKLNTTGGQNYSAVESFDTQTLTINQNASSCGVFLNESSQINYLHPVTVWTNCTSDYTLYLNQSAVTNDSSHNFGAGLWNFTVQRTDNANYSEVENTQLFTINPTQSLVNLTLNNSGGNKTVYVNDEIWVNCSTINGDSNAWLTTWKEGVKLNNGTSPFGNLTLFNTIQVENITCTYEGTQNYTINSTTYWVNVTKSFNVPPVITEIYNETMTDVSAGPNEGPSPTPVIINFTAQDENGFENLNDSSARINFTYNGEVRENVSCARILEQSSGNYANYTCNVTMWWWDSPGTWSISATIKDNEQNEITNDSSTFYLGLTTGFKTDYSSLSFPEISPGSTGIESLEVVILNNTGNDEVSIEINATNLYGESNPAYALGASNFSSHTSVGCGGTSLVLQSYTTISGALLQIGNYTINDGTAQEELYFCMEQANSDLIAQFYSTDSAGSWTIRIFMVVFAIAGGTGRRKKKSIKDDKLLEALGLITEELKKEYSLTKNQLVELLLEKLSDKHKINRFEILNALKISEKEKLGIPSTIFSKELGALETLVKYMKENLNMSYKEISERLNRNERTVWSAYKSSVRKLKEKFKNLEEGVDRIPLSIFGNKNLTILEALISYLKENKNLKYSEIGDLIKRDQRNIWTIYSRGKNKLK